MTHILIVDDHPIARRGVRRLLADMTPTPTIGEALDGDELLDRLRTSPWDLVIMDLHMPRRGGMAALTEVRSLYPDLPVLVLSMFPAEHFGQRAMALGAAGYVGKSEGPVILKQAIERVLAGGKYVSQQTTGQMLGTATAWGEPGALAQLTPREFQALALLGRGQPVAQVATALGVSPKTVLFYKHRILRKLGLKNQEELALFCIRHSLVPWATRD